MMVARAAGLPVPLVISYEDHPDTPHAPVSILTTRLPGEDKHLSDKERQTVSDEMHTILGTMRSWSHPWEKERLCSMVGTSIRSVRVPNHTIEPCESESEFNEQLISTASKSNFPLRDVFEQKPASVKRLHSVPHSIVFTHGDLKHHNIMVHNGYVSRFIDWGSTGWYPDYWEYTTALRFCQKGFWWYKFVSQLTGSEFTEEMESEQAFTALTVDSYAW